jgi:hypothetical protein
LRRTERAIWGSHAHREPLRRSCLRPDQNRVAACVGAQLVPAALGHVQRASPEIVQPARGTRIVVGRHSENRTIGAKHETRSCCDPFDGLDGA